MKIPVYKVARLAFRSSASEWWDLEARWVIKPKFNQLLTFEVILVLSLCALICTGKWVVQGHSLQPWSHLAWLDRVCTVTFLGLSVSNAPWPGQWQLLCGAQLLIREELSDYGQKYPGDPNSRGPALSIGLSAPVCAVALVHTGVRCKAYKVGEGLLPLLPLFWLCLAVVCLAE